MSTWRKTHPASHLTVIRVLIAIPLVGIGVQHLIGMAPMQPILEGANLPLAAPLAIIVPILEVVVGLALVIGLFARPAALLAIATMAVAIYAHLVHDWADEPVLILPIAVMVGALQILVSGAGAFSTDLAAQS